MKLNYIFISMLFIFLYSCDSTKKITNQVVNETEKPVMVEKPSAPVITKESITYYRVEMDSENKEVFTEQNVTGNSTFSMNAERVPTLKIIVEGTDQVINCIERMHPTIGRSVFVEL